MGRFRLHSAPTELDQLSPGRRNAARGGKIINTSAPQRGALNDLGQQIRMLNIEYGMLKECNFKVQHSEFNIQHF
jgi:hypothetical protein